MVKIKFTNLDFVYDMLEKNPDLARMRLQDSGESWKGEGDESMEIIKKTAGFKYNAVELPYPLEHAGFIVRRVGELYTACLPIIPREKWVFDGLSKKLVEGYKERGKLFNPTTDDGTGYIINGKNGELFVDAVIMALGKDDEVRDIAIGGNGACERKFYDKDDFLVDVSRLEKDVNVFLDACFKNAIEKGRIRDVPDLTVTFAT